MGLRERLNGGSLELTKFKHDLVEVYNVASYERDGRRYYSCPTDMFLSGVSTGQQETDYVSYASVTTIIKENQDQTKLDEWRQRIGQEAADIISFQARSRGNAIHEMAEKVLMNDPEYAKDQTTMDVQNFNRLIPVLNTHISKVYGVELPLWSHRLKTAGRSDAVVVWDEENAIMDFKGSSKKKYKKYIEHYFIQAATYALMFEERYKLAVPRIVIVVLVDDAKESTVFVEQTKNWIRKINEIFG